MKAFRKCLTFDKLFVRHTFNLLALSTHIIMWKTHKRELKIPLLKTKENTMQIKY